MAYKIILGYIFLITSVVNAQKKSFFKEIGFNLGFGHGVSRYNLPEGIYRPCFIMGHFGIDILKKNPLNFNNGSLTLYFEPQFNPVFIENQVFKTLRTNFEFGLNIGLKQTIHIYKPLYAFIHCGIGPHFLNFDNKIQNKGFLFSDNLGLGISYTAKKNLFFSVGFRLRHLSNAYLSSPNYGLNTFNYHFGISWILD